ncbi:hypothetical protein K461DRAFT_320595 [Myriangium duriaei CBS 260.36]|uniref:Uncharacterized protein n=1 Tax=Myriangium duriaei CBS 260.36 TaxID=1168546 RepID=A0A9P4J4K3_9PEZI|nr:hypothetical protein K461DRAFT_320595 [Myriangium duriaei CBS 260.36]
MAVADLAFIVSAGPRVSDDPAVRKLIRQQAMKNVALTRKSRRPRVDCNTLIVTKKSPTTCLKDDLFPPATKNPEEVHDILSKLSYFGIGDDLSDVFLVGTDPEPCSLMFNPMVSPSPPLLTEYEAARSMHNVDIVDLSMLTCFCISKNIIPMLTADPSLLKTLIGHDRWSYVQYIPGLYRTSKCLATATDCVLSKVRSLLSPSPAARKTATELYSRALRILQQDLQDSVACLGADVLCASLLLCLYELLSSTDGGAAWTQHMNGCVKLIKHRTPDRFQTDFEKALFYAHTGPVVFEALSGSQDCRYGCYLQEGIWSQLYSSISEDSDELTGRSPLAIALKLELFALPGLWLEIDECINNGELLREDVTCILEVRCRQADYKFTSWLQRYKAYCLSKPSYGLTSAEVAERRELQGLALECSVVVKRLISTVCGHRTQRLAQEELQAADALLEMQNGPKPQHAWMLSGSEVAIAQSIISTHGQWIVRQDNESALAARVRRQAQYKAWTRLLGWTTWMD